MKKFNYIEEANRTMTDSWFGEYISVHEFSNAINRAIVDLMDLDTLKKKLFYGKGVKLNKAKFDLSATIGTNDTELQVLTHCIIGKATECGELLELLHSVLRGHPIDIPNLIEELGDDSWYTAGLCKQFGFTFEQIQKVNISKLKVRFPEKFTKVLANERDLKKERKVLEKGIDKV